MSRALRARLKARLPRSARRWVRRRGCSAAMRLASNESPLGRRPRPSRAYRAHLAAELHRYPDGAARRCAPPLAAASASPARAIVCGAGSDEMISLLLRAYAGPGDEVLYSQYGFVMYPIAAKAVGATPVGARTDLRRRRRRADRAGDAATRICFSPIRTTRPAPTDRERAEAPAAPGCRARAAGRRRGLCRVRRRATTTRTARRWSTRTTTSS